MPIRPRSGQPPLEHRVHTAITQAHHQGVDVSVHQAAIERRLQAMTARIAQRHAPHRPRAQ